ncbi:MAG: hypothetical protein QXJ06_04970 [Candidatus Aenigmatarchaeota archaeon]
MTSNLFERITSEFPQYRKNLIFEITNLLELVGMGRIADKLIKHCGLEGDYKVWAEIKEELGKIDPYWRLHAMIVPTNDDGSVQIDYGGFRIKNPYAACIIRNRLSKGESEGYFEIYPRFGGEDVPDLSQEYGTRGWLTLEEAVNIAKAAISGNYKRLKEALNK